MTQIIAAVQRTIDGPSGWLGRALGKQRLIMEDDGWCGRDVSLYYPPIIGNIVVQYLDVQGVLQTVDQSSYRTVDTGIRFSSSFSFPRLACEPDAVRVQYDAGYEADNVPPEAKRAVILMALKMTAFSKESLFLRSEEVDGVGKIDYTIFDQAGEVLRKASDELLMGLRMYG
ncbi:hypothetical protein [Neorhizobium galegae]|uniref:hypothetical protein n=1 Tax=Neorhizobium galegae TaxID=399 RepID=UPI001F434645|nr:hypothetical protein [Neorhizobium galegae]UIK04903.1 hypothetical protein LZK81_19950 [Neorhizobium galegae]